MHSEIRQPVRIWEDFLLVQAAERTDCLQRLSGFGTEVII